MAQSSYFIRLSVDDDYTRRGATSALGRASYTPLVEALTDDRHHVGRTIHADQMSFATRAAV